MVGEMVTMEDQSLEREAFYKWVDRVGLFLNPHQETMMLTAYRNGWQARAALQPAGSWQPLPQPPQQQESGI